MKRAFAGLIGRRYYVYTSAIGSGERTVKTAKLFSHGGSQAVRLPKEFRFEGQEVHIRRVGDEVVLSAAAPASADALIHALEAFEPGVRIVRDQPAEQSRPAIDPVR